MADFTPIAWLHWDPSRFAFTLPFIHHPVTWYGLCFALGFILGFLIIIPLIEKRLIQDGKLKERDIANWPLLISQIKNNARFKKLLSTGTLQELRAHSPKQEPGHALKEKILTALSQSKTSFDRKSLAATFPQAIYTTRELAIQLTDRLTWFVVAGTIVGARLGHVFFYEWPRYQAHPFDILKIWEGGLASHGGALGVMAAVFLFQRSIRERFPEYSFVTLLDTLTIPTAFVAVMIRIGNFFNQEILGPVTTAPWAVVFGHPYSGPAGLPRHPTQLYEAAAYLLVFIVLYVLWRKEKLKQPGMFIGLFMLLVFGFRFFLEFFKGEQSAVFNESVLYAGQLLSIPFILLGLFFLILYPRWANKRA